MIERGEAPGAAILGFIGTGHITTAMVTGLCTAESPPPRVLVSPRGAANAAALATRFPTVEIAPSNQAVVDGAEVVLIALRTEHAAAALGGLSFRPGQLACSLMGTMPLDTVRRLLDGHARLVRAGPLPTSAKCMGPVAYYPEGAEAEAVLARFGQPMAVAGEAQFNTFWCLVGLIATVAGLFGEVGHWAAERGIEAGSADAFLAALFQAVTAQAREDGFAAVAEAAATPGGLNEQAARAFRADGGFEALRDALDSMHARLAGG